MIDLSEADIQKQIIQYLALQENMGNLYFLRNNSFSGFIERKNAKPGQERGFIKNNKKGTADIIVCRKGIFVGLEVKSATGKQSRWQKEAENKILKAGGQYYVVRSVEDVFKALKWNNTVSTLYYGQGLEDYL